MEKKNRIKGIAGTIVFHVLLAMLLVLFAFKTPLPLPEEMGVEVDFSGGGGGGSEGWQYTETSSENESQQDVSNTYQTSNPQNVVTQNTEQTHHMTSQTNTQSQPVVDPRISDFWSTKQSGGTQGSGTGSGTGDGSGPGFNLHGRSAKYLPIPDYTEQDQGKVVVDVWVDKNGNVTRAIAGAKGTTTSSPGLWRKAQQAALNAKFSVNLNAPEEQKGTITYNFIRLGN